MARYEFPGNRVIYYTLVAGMLFPVFLALVPLFFVVHNLGMLGTYHGLILVYAAYAAAVHRLLPARVLPHAAHGRRGGRVPRRAARTAAVFFRVMLPMARPGLVSVGIFNFLGLWNQYLLPLVLNPDPDRYVLAQGLAALAVSQGYRSDWSGLFAGLIIAILPVLSLTCCSNGRSAPA